MSQAVESGRAQDLFPLLVAEEPAAYGGAAGRIHVLAPEVAHRIAAGEVIERPASAVKELVENALDAGASRVEVEIEGGGVSLVRVSDDGSGMPPEDARRAIEAHATSKIETADDLVSVASLGFRGEALHAIGSVCALTLTTCERGASRGTQVRVLCGEVLGSCPAARAPGTTVEARDLFINLPVRRGFLGTPRAEAHTTYSNIHSHAIRTACGRTDRALKAGQHCGNFALMLFVTMFAVKPGVSYPYQPQRPYSGHRSRTVTGACVLAGYAGRRDFWDLSGGILVCGECGRAMNAITIDKPLRGQRYYYYACRSRYRDSAPNCSHTKCYPAEFLEQWSAGFVSELLSNKGALLAAIDGAIDAQANPDKKAAALNKRLGGLLKERDGYIRLAAQGRIADADLDGYLYPIDSEREQIAQSLTALKASAEKVETLQQDKAALMRQYDSWALVGLSPQQRHETYKRYGIEVSLYPDGGMAAELDGIDHKYKPLTISHVGAPVQVEGFVPLESPRTRGFNSTNTGVAFAATLTADGATLTVTGI